VEPSASRHPPIAEVACAAPCPDAEPGETDADAARPCGSLDADGWQTARAASVYRYAYEMVEAPAVAAAAAEAGPHALREDSSARRASAAAETASSASLVLVLLPLAALAVLAANVAVGVRGAARRATERDRELASVAAVATYGSRML
jgi:hypothetical protein